MTPNNSSDWQDYEVFIRDHFQRQFPGASIRHNVILPGQKSNINRQIDLLIEADIAGFSITIAIDCKYFSRKVDVKHVDEFLGYLDDLRVSKGVIITNSGYTKAAYDRAMHETRDVELRIVRFDELEKFQSFVAIPYFGAHAAIISAPPGWIIDINPPKPQLAAIHPLGTTLSQAFHTEGYIYVMASIKDANWPTLDALLATQQLEIVQHYSNPRFQQDDVSIRDDCRTVIRTLEAAELQHTTEATLFIDFEKAVLFLNLLSPSEKYNDYYRKLIWIAEKLQRLNVIHK